MAEPEASRVYLTYAGKKHVLEYHPGFHNTVGDLAADVAGLLGLAPETIKLLPGAARGGAVVHLLRDAAQTLQQAGVEALASYCCSWTPMQPCMCGLHDITIHQLTCLLFPAAANT